MSPFREVIPWRILKSWEWYFRGKLDFHLLEWRMLTNSKVDYSSRTTTYAISRLRVGRIFIFSSGPEFVGSQQCSCGCPDGWVTYQSSCYLFSNMTGVHYVEAEHYCLHHHGTHLVAVDTLDENTFLRDYVSRLKGVQYWIGITDEMVESQWKVESTGKRVTYTDWIPGQPDNTLGKEDCAAFEPRYDYHWNDWPCTSNFRPLCGKSILSEMIIGWNIVYITEACLYITAIVD